MPKHYGNNEQNDNETTNKQNKYNMYIERMNKLKKKQ